MNYSVVHKDGIVAIVLGNEEAYLRFPLSEGFHISDFTEADKFPDLNTQQWDPINCVFIDSVDKLSKVGFLTRFSVEERVAIRASTDPIVIDIMHMLNNSEFVSTSDPTTIQSVGYLYSVGLLTSQRVIEILG